MKVSLQLLENNLLQQIPTIIITSGQKKYIFNMPSCFQRFVKDHKIKMPKSAHYFFTKASSTTIAGLHGFMMTIFETGSTDSKLYLNNAMYQYFEDIRYKMGFKIMPFSYCNWQGKCRLGLRDRALIQSLIRQQDYVEIFQNFDKFILNLNKPDIINNSKQLINEDGVFKDDELRIIPIHLTSNGELITNYICIMKPPQGKVFNEKIKELKINPKDIPLILQNGSLKMADGRIVMRSQIKDETKFPSPAAIILHINNLQAIMLILQNHILNNFLVDNNNQVAAVVYIVENQQIVNTEEFKILLKMFPQHTEHILCSKGIKDKLLNVDEYIVPHMKRVSQLSQRFPQCIPDICQIQKNSMANYLKGCQSIEELLPEFKFHVCKKGYEMVILPVKSRGYKSIAQKVDKIDPLNQLKNPQIQTMDIQIPWDVKLFNPKLVFLGTGSMKPSQYRNVSSILLQLDGNNSVIMDCGEGTFYQLMNHYPLEESDKRLLDIQILFITHIHSDHNLGILDLISRRNKLMKQYKDYRRLYLIIPCNVYPWFISFSNNIEDLSYGCDLIFIQSIRGQPCSMSEGSLSKQQMCLKYSEQIKQEITFKQIPMPIKQQIKQKFLGQLQIQPQTLNNFNAYLNKLGIMKFQPIPVIHCPQSYGVVILHQTKVKISYSGDTRPSQQFTKAAGNSTILVHEATMGDQLINNAIQNFHSTVGEAIQVGIKSGSWKTALTHFSQRYVSAALIVNPNNYKIQQQLQKYLVNNTIVCYDHLQIKLSQSPFLPKITQQISKSIPAQQ